MAILKIARMGHPVLKRVAQPIDDPGAPEVRRLVNDMLDTLEDAGGTGLAAPQVHVPRRLVLFYVSTERAQRENERENGQENGRENGREDGEDGEDAPDEAEEVPLTVLVNPTLEPLSEETVVSWEACLSLPDLAGRVPRYKAVRYRGLDLRGEEIVREARGFHARVVQHECDHLDGVLYPQRMTDLSTLTFASELKARAGVEVAED
jgi:peptide deformylase